MHVRGIVQSAELEENPPGSDRIEMILRVQGVGPGQPRKFVVPYEILLQNPEIEPEAIAGHGFDSEVEEEVAGSKRWVAVRIEFAARRVLRPDAE
jgi:hypothetical protein